MFKSSLYLFATLLVSLFSFLTSANAATIDFDDIPVDAQGWALMHDYAGLSWVGFSVLDAKNKALTTGQLNGLVSGSNVVLASSYDAIGSFSSPEPFTFNGGYFTKSWALTAIVTLTGWLDNDQKYMTEFSISNAAPTKISLDWMGINQVKIALTTGSPVVMDNLQISHVPLPAALPLFGGALMALIGARAARKKKV